MKKIMSLLIGVFVTLTLLAQPPHPGQRPLPNQFRDFVDHQQRAEMGRPQIERKDGKVIITMSEEQFKRMQQMRMAQRYRMVHYVQPKCNHKRHFSKSVKNRKRAKF